MSESRHVCSQAKILSAQIEPCDSDPCVLKRGTKPKVYFTVTSDQDTEKATLDATIGVFGLEISVPGLDKDLCENMVKCPISKGQTYSGVMEVFVPLFAPANLCSMDPDKKRKDKNMSNGLLLDES
ncbi:hypothetical protein HPB51_021375 [Rhipicephalus microplus]|uniref:MD-2-related lipid-recognition domain-containing protein n=1 Tax=Rhipicephalus microplus TaxID=6941 RepID=A0A9J6F7X8_RHIMP|nr:hypothetical protein HPB51_021375 [Rhipicephalus microplus]